MSHYEWIQNTWTMDIGLGMFSQTDKGKNKSSMWLDTYGKEVEVTAVFRYQNMYNEKYLEEYPDTVAVGQVFHKLMEVR